MNEEVQEEWRDIIGYEGEYQISNTGKVKSIKTGKVLYQRINPNNGYYMLCLCKNGKQTTHTIHRLIAEAFIPNPENKPCIDHIDCNRTNNSLSNLRWVTYSENSSNPLTIQHQSSAQKEVWTDPEYREKMSNAHNTPEYWENNKEFYSELWRKNAERSSLWCRKEVICLENGLKWDSCKALAKFLGVGKNTVSRYCLGENKCSLTVKFEDGSVIKSPHFEYVNKNQYREIIKRDATKIHRNKVRCKENNQMWDSVKTVASLLEVSDSAVRGYCLGKHQYKRPLILEDGTTITNPHFEYVTEEEENTNV